jgi:hypothetical protein
MAIRTVIPISALSSAIAACAEQAPVMALQPTGEQVELAAARAKPGSALIGLALVVAYARYQTPPAGQSPFRVSVGVALVVLHATVTGRQGSLVTNLGRAGFSGLRERRAQHIQLVKNEDFIANGGSIECEMMKMDRLVWQLG